MTTPKFSVAIVRGGIAGLTSAITMSRLNPDNNIKIDVYEGARAFTAIGAGVGVWKRPWGVMKKLGLAEDLGRICKALVITDEPRKLHDSFSRISSNCQSNKSLHSVFESLTNPRVYTTMI